MLIKICRRQKAKLHQLCKKIDPFFFSVSLTSTLNVIWSVSMPSSSEFVLFINASRPVQGWQQIVHTNNKLLHVLFKIYHIIQDLSHYMFCHGWMDDFLPHCLTHHLMISDTVRTTKETHYNLDQTLDLRNLFAHDYCFFPNHQDYFPSLKERLRSSWKRKLCDWCR